MGGSPGHEGEAGAVPEAAQRHRGEQSRDLDREAVSIAAERNVEVVAQEPRQGHVPTPPEVPQRGGAVGNVEILRQQNAEHERDAERHVGIAREVEIDLEGEAEGGLPGLHHGHGLARRRGLEDRIDEGCQRIAEEDLLRQAHAEEQDAAPEALGPVGPCIGSLVELVHDLAPAHEGAGQNLREERDVEGVADEVVGRRPASTQVDEIHHMVEGEERDPERQHQIGVGQARAGDEVREIGEEVQVLEGCQNREVGGDSERDRPTDLRPQEESRQEPVQADRAGEQRHEADVPPAIEHEGQGKEDGQPPIRPEPRGEPVQDQRGRQERQEERERVEEHRGRIAGATVSRRFASRALSKIARWPSTARDQVVARSSVLATHLPVRCKLAPTCTVDGREP